MEASIWGFFDILKYFIFHIPPSFSYFIPNFLEQYIHRGRLALCVCVCVHETEKESDQSRKEKEGRERDT